MSMSKTRKIQNSYFSESTRAIVWAVLLKVSEKHVAAAAFRFQKFVSSQHIKKSVKICRGMNKRSKEAPVYLILVFGPKAGVP